MSGECLNCGAQVTTSYVRVFAPPELQDRMEVRGCPNCTMVREHGGVRKAQARGDASVEGDGA
jgi:DNA-directed RNA polymerase subunit RPC12/RpoP